MNLREEILKEHSKEQMQKIASWVGNSQQRFDILFGLFMNDEYRVVQRAAWPLSHCVQAFPELIAKHFKNLLANLQKPGVHNAVKRNTMRVLQDIQVPEKFHGELMNTCFDFIASPEEPIAVKAFSLTVLDHLSKTYPEIRPELKLIIEERWNYETAAFKSRGKKILKKM